MVGNVRGASQCDEHGVFRQGEAYLPQVNRFVFYVVTVLVLLIVVVRNASNLEVRPHVLARVGDVG